MTSAEPQPSSDSSEKTLRRLLDETSDLIDSPAFTHVLTQLVDAGFSTLIDHKIAEEDFKRASAPAQPPTVSDPTDDAQPLTGDVILAIADEQEQNSKAEPKAKVANILAVMTRQARIVGQGDTNGNGGLMAADFGDDGISSSNEYLQAMNGCHNLEAFAAVIFSSNFEVDEVYASNDADSRVRVSKASEEGKEPIEQPQSGQGKAILNARDKQGQDSMFTPESQGPSKKSQEQEKELYLATGDEPPTRASPTEEPDKTADEDGDKGEADSAPALPPRPVAQKPLDQVRVHDQNQSQAAEEEGGDQLKQETLEDAWGKAVASTSGSGPTPGAGAGEGEGTVGEGEKTGGEGETEGSGAGVK